MTQLSLLINAMTDYERGVPERVGHFLKVYGYAKAIGELEGLTTDAQFTLEVAAIVHDIGIKSALAKYGNSAGNLQEQEGTVPAREMLERLGFAADVTDRVCFLVSRHHTYSDVDGPDYQILLEADMLVNIHENTMPPEAAQAAYDRVFKTEAGKRLCRLLYLPESID